MSREPSRSPVREIYEGEAEAESSHVQVDDEGPSDTELPDGMDPEGFSGPTVKPLTPEALAAFNAAQERAGVVYISRIPPGMRPSKVRHLMSGYGEVGRVYLQQEGMLEPTLPPIANIILLKMRSGHT